MNARSLMALGTASHVGKSLLTTGLGRIFSDEGFRVAPFKAQNMSLNSAATPEGREIGRAQALQAEACRVLPRAEMNPILIKPSSDMHSQVIVLGRVWGQLTAAAYHRRRVEDLFPIVLESYRTLACSHDLVLLEGAGSPAEINLRDHDIVNMRMAHAAHAACLLVGDIDRGGVFASLLGTMELLPAEDRPLIHGFVINKFRGDVSLLLPGIEMMERRLGIPCAGIIPFLREIGLDEEDGVVLEDRLTPARVWREPETVERALRVGIIVFPHMANFTDFDALAMEPSVALAFLDDPASVERADLLILPGTKQTIDDLAWLGSYGFAEALARFHGAIVGICGGFQMLGTSIDDPAGVESAATPRSAAGLGILPIRTTMNREKTVRRATGKTHAFGGAFFNGYEIHMGETVYENAARPFAEVMREGDRTARVDGAIDSSGRVWGTYIHGILDDDAFRHRFVDASRAASGLAPARDHVRATANREARIDRWANHLRKSLNMDLIRGWIGVPANGESGGAR